MARGRPVPGSAAAAVPRSLIVAAIIAGCIVALAAGGWVLLRVLNFRSARRSPGWRSRSAHRLLLPLKLASGGPSATATWLPA